jgi:hypothetical protein
MTILVLSLDTAPLLAAVRAVLDTDDLPAAALIGGLAVTVRVAAPATTYRATADIDIVTTDADPTLVELLTTRHNTSEPLHVADMLDVYRLVETHNPDGGLATQVHDAPGHLAPVIAHVIRTEILANPAKAAMAMASTSPVPADTEDLAATLESFIEDLDTGPA